MMVDQPPDDDPSYRVGRGKPPRSTRFQPGKSGNPNGKPKGTRSLKTRVLDAFSKKMTVTSNGQAREIEKLDVLLSVTIDRGLQGKERSAMLALQLAQRYFGDEHTTDNELLEDDWKIIQRYLDACGLKIVKTGSGDDTPIGDGDQEESDD